MGQRISRWKRSEVAHLMEMAGWNVRTGSEGHVLLQKGSETITLGSDPVHLNAIAQVERALGIHIEKVTRKVQGKPTSVKQFTKRLVLAKAMDKAGFGWKKINQQCSLSGLYERGFRIDQLRVRDPSEFAKELHSASPKPKPQESKVKSSPGSGRVPSPPNSLQAEPPQPKPEEKDESWKKTKPLGPIFDSREDLNALLELLGNIDSKIDGNAAAAHQLAGTLKERLRLALDEAKHLRLQLKEVDATVARMMKHFEIGG